MAGSSENQSSSNPPAQEDFLIQYILVRKDLWEEMGWPRGPVITQACHACAAILEITKQDEITKQYLAQENLDHMRKVVLELKDEKAMTKLSQKLSENDILHKVWIEEPEHIPTALAIKPYPKSIIAPLVKRYKLCN